jgi:thiol-disulfide isomerase/thioredoxin
MRATPILILVAAGVMAAAAGYFYRQHGSASVPAEATETAGTPLPAGVVLTDLDGVTHKLQDWHGKLLMINFWATWCTPCLKEIPLLTKAQTEYASRGLQIIGPAVDDPEEVKKAAKGPLAINYPVMTGTPDAMLGLLNDFGNTAGALPFSVIVAADGTVVHQQLGEFTAEDLKQLVEAHLPK